MRKIANKRTILSIAAVFNILLWGLIFTRVLFFPSKGGPVTQTKAALKPRSDVVVHRNERFRPESGEMIPGGPLIGNADAQGFLHIWKYIGTIHDGAVTIPVSLDFSSGNIRSNIFLGRYWKCSMIESSVVQVSDGAMILLTPWGEKAYLFRQGDTLYMQGGSTFVSGFRSEKEENPTWTANIQTNGDIHVVENSGLTMDFKEGRIASLKSGGIDIAWRRQPESVDVVDPNSVEVLASVKRSGPDTVSISLGDQSTQISLHSVPWLDAPCVEKVSGEELSFTCRYPTTNNLVIESRGTKKQYEWSAQNATISNDDASTYVVNRDKWANVTGIIRNYQDGFSESWSINRNSGVSAFKTSSGVEITTTFSTRGTPGKPTKSTTVVDGKLQKEQLYDYDGNGSLAKISVARSDETNASFVYDANGTIQQIK